MEELGTPAKLMDDRMGHDDGSVQALYTDVTREMRRRLMDGLTEVWGDGSSRPAADLAWLAGGGPGSASRGSGR